MRSLAVGLLLCSSVSFADAPSPQAVAAKKALYAIEDTRASTGLTASKQGALALDELAQPGYGLSPTVRNAVASLRAADPGKRMTIIGQLLATEGQAFLKEACESVDVNGLYETPIGKLVDECHLKPGHLAPTMRQGSLLLAGYVDRTMTNRGASPEELRLARWVGHYERTDAGAKPMARP